MVGPAEDGQMAVRVACLPARAEASHRSEMVTQWLCGEPLVILERTEDWARCRGPDGYEGWCSTGGLVAPRDPAGWARRATARSLGAWMETDEEGGARLWLPFGAWLAPREGDTFLLPDGAVTHPPRETSMVTAEERPARFPPRPEAVVESARRWLGVPYLWGGRTEAGVDCSGLVQALFALHGVTLPRDSGPQSRVGPRVEGSRELPECRPGDLLFFGRAVAEREQGKVRPPGDDPFQVTHVALSTGGAGILHAAAANGQVAEDDLSGEAPLAKRLRERLLVVRRPLEDAADPEPTERP